jgi:predicted Zn-dependent peptidase
MKTKKSSIQIKYVHGYKILLVPTPHHTIHIQSVVHSGFIDETKHTSGINHLLEHILVSSWKRCKESCIAYWDKNGEILNATTDTTVMTYYVKGLLEDVKDMIEYIATITTHPALHESTLEREKHAIVEELYTSSGDHETALINIFNKHFFKEEGLQYSDDWKQQVHNLKTITLHDIRKMFYDNFNTKNVMFVVYGKYTTSMILSLFSTYLKKNTSHSHVYHDCFTNQPQFLYTPFQKESNTVLLAFPCTTIIPYTDLCKEIFKTLLLDLLRTQHKLVYSVDCDFNTTRCNTYFYIKFDVSEPHMVRTLQHVIDWLITHTTHTIEPDVLKGCKKKIIYQYLTTYDFMEYYSRFIHITSTPLTRAMLIQQTKACTLNDVKDVVRSVVNFKKAMCIYQGKKDSHVSWNSFKI